VATTTTEMTAEHHRRSIVNLDPIRAPRLLRQILATRSFHRNSHSPTKVLTGQAELAVGKAEEARRRGYSTPKDNSDGLAVT
jgi:hypothetical protein